MRRDPFAALFFDFQKSLDKGNDTGFYIAGDCVAWTWTSGWVEGALQTALNAAAGVIKSLQGTLNGDANGRSPFDIKADRFNYHGA